MSPPQKPLCQHENGSCAACCGVYNFRDRSIDATHRRLKIRTERVRNAWPDVEKLAEVRDEILTEEKADILFSTVRVCPFAGYVEEGRVGCMIHPTRHPDGEDLRDLAVYPKEVCRDHFCAPHDWLRPREVIFAQSAEGISYGLVVTDAGLVKSLLGLLESRMHRPIRADDVADNRDALSSFWKSLLDWPFRDPDPHRFGGFLVIGDEAVERTLPSCLAGLDVEASPAERTVLDGLGTRLQDSDMAERALACLRQLLDGTARAIDEDA